MLVRSSSGPGTVSIALCCGSKDASIRPSYDRWLPYGFAVVNALTLIVLVLARYNQLDHGLETAKYAQAAWQIGEDLKPITTLSGGNILAEQGSLIVYPLGLLTSVFPRTETLLIVKSLALAITVVPLWRLARRHGRLGIGATSTIVFAYSIYTYVHNMNIADFAPAVLAVPALMFAVLAGFDAKKRTMTAAIIFVLCCRADLGLAVAGLGVLLVLEHYRDRKARADEARDRFETAEDLRRVGAIAIVLGLAWFITVMYTLQRSGGYGFLEPYAEFGDTPLGVLGGIISHPVKFAQSVGSQANFQILVTLLAPVLFLPLTAPRYLMPAVPLYVLYMGADVEPGRLREAAQSVPMTVFVFVGNGVRAQADWAHPGADRPCRTAHHPCAAADGDRLLRPRFDDHAVYRTVGLGWPRCHRLRPRSSGRHDSDRRTGAGDRFGAAAAVRAARGL